MVRTFSKEEFHIPDQCLLQVLKAFENALESQLIELETIFMFV